MLTDRVVDAWLAVKTAETIEERDRAMQLARIKAEVQRRLGIERGEWRWVFRGKGCE